MNIENRRKKRKMKVRPNTKQERQTAWKSERIDRETASQLDRQPDRQTAGQADKEMEREKER